MLRTATVLGRRLATPVGASVRTRALATDAAPLAQTALHDRHVEIGGQMVPFAGYSMPVQYAGEGIKDSHLWVRANAGIFDISHMGEIKLHGPDRTDFLETLVVGDIAVLNENQSVLSLITNETGGIIDDTIITNQGKNISMVVNGACKHKDIAHMKEQLSAFQAKGKEVEMEIIDDHQMFALQGPKAMDVLASYVKQSGVDLVHMPFMTALPMTLLGIPCQVTRCGYTGEDGCEISVPTYGAVELWDSLTANEAVHATGLGARDSLRLEAGLCLYGNDATSETSPVEAGLNWTIGKRRRVEGGFIGEEVILEQLKNGITRRRMAFEVTKGAPARGGEAIVDKETGEEVGFVTSGGFGPTVGKSIGMGYCNKPWNKTGTEIAFKVRNKLSHAIVRKMPIVPAQYYKVPE